MTCEKCAERREKARKALLNAAMGVSCAVKRVTRRRRKSK